MDDVREKVHLTANQKIGLEYFYEFDERMQREEVARIEKVVSCTHCHVEVVVKEYCNILLLAELSFMGITLM